MKPFKWFECKLSSAKIIRIVWREDTTYDPAGYYALIKFKDSLHQVLLSADSNEPELSIQKRKK